MLFEDIYEGYFRCFIIIPVSLLLGALIHLYLTKNIWVASNAPPWIFTTKINHLFVIYCFLTAFLTSIFGLKIFVKGRKKFLKQKTRVIINIIGVMSCISLAASIILMITILDISLYYKIRIIIFILLSSLTLLIAILIILKPGFYLINAYNVYYFITYQSETGLLLYARNYMPSSISIDLLGALLTAIESSAKELIKTTIKQVTTRDYVIIIENRGK